MTERPIRTDRNGSPPLYGTHFIDPSFIEGECIDIDVPTTNRKGRPSMRNQPDIVAKIASVCHEANRAICEAQGDTSQTSWDEAPDWQRASAIKGVEFHLANPEATPAASHQSWLAVKLDDGWVWGPEKNAEMKIHPCIVGYEELPFEQRVKDHVFRAIVHALKSSARSPVYLTAPAAP